MDDLILVADSAQRLTNHIQAHQRKVVTAVLQSNGTSRPGSIAASIFVNSLLDRVALECETRDCSALDTWVSEFGSTDPVLDYSTLVLVAFATLAVSFTTHEGSSSEIVRHLAIRGNHLEHIVSQTRLGRLHDRLPDPTQVVAKEDLVSSLLATLEVHSPMAAEHSRAAGAWCRRIAEAMGMNPEGVHFITLCGTLHDIGKIGTPKEILTKPGPLTNDEWDVMRAHVTHSSSILEKIPSLCDLAPVVRAHHERFDGLGYPDRLKSNEIPLVARIVSVADSFNAMISKRPHRAAVSVTQAMSALMAGRGTQWDPMIIDVMLTVVKPQAIAQQRQRLSNAG